MTSEAIKRVFIVVLDGVGAGELPDADKYGDVGSNTLSHTATAVGGLNLPAMQKLGLGNITEIEGCASTDSPTGYWGKMREASPGKDTITGHWEIAGVVLKQPFPTYPNGFPPAVIESFEKAIGRGSLGNYASSGTTILTQLGDEHVKTGKPIVYTSADSVFQIAMHEDVIPIEQQYEICEKARALLVGEHEVGRVICRPFIGGNGQPYSRTERRKDFPVAPPQTVLDELIDAGKRVHAIGKIYEIFNGRGVTSYDHTTNNADHTKALLTAAKSNESELIFANLEDFDMLYGHRNDPKGMAKALETWDEALPEILAALRPGDLFLITADHGNDPTTASTDHSREHPFLVIASPNFAEGGTVGTRMSYSDIAATVREAFDLPIGEHGDSFLEELKG